MKFHRGSPWLSILSWLNLKANKDYFSYEYIYTFVLCTHILIHIYSITYIYSSIRHALLRTSHPAAQHTHIHVYCVQVHGYIYTRIHIYTNTHIYWFIVIIIYSANISVYRAYFLNYIQNLSRSTSTRFHTSADLSHTFTTVLLLYYARLRTHYITPNSWAAC